MNIAATLSNPLNMTDSSLNDKFTAPRSVFSSQGWLIQLRAHHPKGCLLSELLQVHDGNYIVRAMVQVDSVTIATAMAADVTIDGAEDQARTRVLEVLGIAPLQLGLPIVPTYLPEVALPEPALPEPEPIAEPAPTLSKATKSKATSRNKPVSVPEIIPEPEPAPIEPIEMTGGGDEPEDEEMEVEYEFTMEDESVELPAVTAAPVELPVESSIDLSDAIAQIGAEIDRIGWTKKQGSSYLQETYSKRTRAELTEPELLSFLQYLKSLPAKIQPNLADLPF
jgi:hypothetical protein